MDIDHDPALEGPGDPCRVMIWKDGKAEEVRMIWGFKPLEPNGRPVSLLRSERWKVMNPCLILANDFRMRTSGTTHYRASLITDQPFFCIAGMWRPANREWPEAFAAFTTAAYPDLAPYKERHVAVVRPEDWFAWLMETRDKLDILRPFPEGCFKVVGPPQQQSFADILDDSLQD